MSFNFTCPFCHQAMQCEDEWNGLEAQCPTCGKQIVLSSSQSAVQHTVMQETLNPNATPEESALVGQMAGEATFEKQTGFEQPVPRPAFTQMFLMLQILFYILGVILLFWEIPFIVVPIIMSIIYFFLPKGGLMFHLLGDERILSTCRVERTHDKGEKDDDGPYFVRMTDKRIVFSAVSYAFLPYQVALIVEAIQRPSSVDIELTKQEIRQIVDEKGGMFSQPKCAIYANEDKYVFLGKSVTEIVKWWNS